MNLTLGRPGRRTAVAGWRGSSFGVPDGFGSASPRRAQWIPWGNVSVRGMDTEQQLDPGRLEFLDQLADHIAPGTMALAAPLVHGRRWKDRIHLRMPASEDDVFGVEGLQILHQPLDVIHISNLVDGFRNAEVSIPGEFARTAAPGMVDEYPELAGLPCRIVLSPEKRRP